MRFSPLFTLLFAARSAVAFPGLARTADSSSYELGDLQKFGLKAEPVNEKRGLLDPILKPLSGLLQALDIPTPQPQGLARIPPAGDQKHRFIPPGPTDVRGLCPTLNALANHGYISRTGVTSFAEVANAQQTVFGFGLDISAVLSLLGLISGGDLLSGKYTLGGYDSRVPSTLGKATGINTHGRFEVDGSISRGDTYFGDNHSFNKTRWDVLVSEAKTENNGLFDAQAGHADRVNKYNEARATNPEFNAGPVYLAVSAATRAFLYRALSNGTTENVANYENVAPWYLEEKIPDNWYRRGTTYFLADFLEDVVDYLINAPIELGQNQGLDNFVPLNAEVPRAPEELVCFIFTEILTLTPQQAAGPLVEKIGEALTAIIAQIIDPLIGSAGYKCNLKASLNNTGSGSGINGSQHKRFVL